MCKGKFFKKLCNDVLLGHTFYVFLGCTFYVFFGIDFDVFLEMDVICIFVEYNYIYEFSPALSWTFGSDLDIFVAIDFDVFDETAPVVFAAIDFDVSLRIALSAMHLRLAFPPPDPHWLRAARAGLHATAFDSSQTPAPAAPRVYRVIRYRAIFAEVCAAL